MTHPDCEAIIQQVWSNTVTTGSPMYCLFEKIKQSRSALVGWSRVTFGQSKSKIQEMQGILEELTRDNSREHLKEIRRVEEINTILYHEEIHWQQRSRSI